MEFSHIDQQNNPRMVDISPKNESVRHALARTEVRLPAEVLAHFCNGDIQSKKGPVFQSAIVAGTMALKQTDRLIPFCHQVPVEASSINITMEGERAVIECSVKTVGKTGVEMEALLGAQIAALTIYDMCKSFGRKMEIDRCRLLKKTGGKSDYHG